MSCIYKITNIVNNKIYIGQTIDPIEYRLQEHIWDAYRWVNKKDDRKCASRLYPAIIKYGKEQFKIEVVHEILPGEKIDELEQYYIKLFNARDPKIGYNIAEGGNKPPSRLGYHHSAASKQKMSEKQAGKKWYNNGKTELMIFKNELPPEGFILGRLATQGFKVGIDNPMFGKPGVNTGKTMSVESRQKISQTKKLNNKSKKLVWYTNDTNEIQINLLIDQEIPAGYHKGRLSKHLNSKKKILAIDIDTNAKKIFESLTQACNILCCSAPTLIKACKNGRLVNNKYLCSYYKGE